MGWVQNRKPELPMATKIRFLGVEGKTDGISGTEPPGYLRLAFPGTPYVSYAHYTAVEVWVPDPPVEGGKETNWYLCSKTGDLFYFSKAEGWFICVNNMTPPLHWDSEKEPRIKDLKRLYKEA